MTPECCRPVEVTERCEVTDLLVDQCACPQHRGGTEPTAVETVGQPFEASYKGWCPLCEKGIRVGDQIARLADGDGYVHAGRCPR